MSTPSDAQVAVVQLRMKLRTLDRYRSTSMGIHNRLVPAFYQLGEQFLTEANELERRFSDDPEVIRWTAKLNEYATQHKIAVKAVKEEKK